VTANKAIADTDWSGCDLVIEASGKMKTVAVLQAYLDQGVKRVVVSAPVKEKGALNVVMGVNQHCSTRRGTASSPPPPAPPTAWRRWSR
jgi:glyceraldehyde 3-phosphate dehydrogenase